MFILAAASDSAHGADHVGPAVSKDAPALFKLFEIQLGDQIIPFEVTNSMLYTWIIAAIILIVIRMGTSNLKWVPDGLQNFIEAIVEGLESATKGLLEPKVVQWVFPLIATFFIFILVSNLMGLLPGVGSIGFGDRDPNSAWPFALKHADIPIFRPPTADANMTLAMSMLFFIMSTWWAIKYNGPLGLLNHIFGVKGGVKGFLLILLVPIFIAVGFIEIIAIMIRPVALAMRLYGNIYGGESVLTIMLGLAGGFAALPFYFLELIVAFVQALVFTMLCIAFIGTLCSHTDTGEGDGHAHH